MKESQYTHAGKGDLPLTSEEKTSAARSHRVVVTQHGRPEADPLALPGVEGDGLDVPGTAPIQLEEVGAR